MTVALCLSCGDTKWGALCPCASCGVASSGDAELDIAFSDHVLEASTLAELGACVRAITAEAEDRGESAQQRFWCFILYVSLEHSDLLSVEIAPEHYDSVRDLYLRVRFPAVELVRRGSAGGLSEEELDAYAGGGGCGPCCGLLIVVLLLLFARAFIG
jgi:hypothetical protein